MKTINHIRKGLVAMLFAMLMPVGAWAQTYNVPVSVTQNADGTWSFTMPSTPVVGSVTVANNSVDEPTELVELPTVGPDDDGNYWSSNWGTYAYKIDGNTQAFIGYYNNGKFVLEEIVDNKIPKNTAVILRSTNNPITITPLTDSEYDDEITGNELKGAPYNQEPKYLRYVIGIRYGKPAMVQTKDQHGYTYVENIPAYQAFYDLPNTELINMGDGVGASKLDLDLTHTTLVIATADAPTEEIESRFFRTFDKGIASTICLPFRQDLTNGKIYGFKGVGKDALDQWTAVMQEPEEEYIQQGYPYLFMPTETKTVTYQGTYKPSILGEYGTGISTNVGGVPQWNFVGNFVGFKWDEEALTTTSPTYGFSADYVPATITTDAVRAGDFVRVGLNTVIRPMRCELRYLGDDDTFLAPGVNGVKPQTTLSERIQVVLLSKNGDITGIGELNTITGDVDMEWYDLSGRKLNTKPSQKGVYIQNGKKVTVK